MCNLSQGIKEDAIAETIEEVVISMYEEGLKIEQIAKIVKKSVEEVQKIIERRNLVLV